MRRLLIVLLVLAALLLVADRVGNYVAERVAADTIKNSQHLQSAPNVDIAGFPFLTQFASRDFQQVTVTADQVPVGSAPASLVLSRVRLVLSDITTSADFSRIHAAKATATGTVDYAALGGVLGVDIRYAGSGRVRVSKRITVLGHTVRPTITAEPAIVNGALSFGRAEINGAGALAGDAARVLSSVFQVHPPLQGIPFQVRVTGLRVDSSGLQISLRGRDITYRR